MAAMAFHFVNRVHVVVHTADNPTDAEWARYLADMQKNNDLIAGIVVYSWGGGPNLIQRQRLTEVRKKQNKVPVALMSSSRIFRGIIRALGWVLNDETMKIFDTNDFDNAFAHIRATPAQREAVLKTIGDLKRELGLKDQAA